MSAEGDRKVESSKPTFSLNQCKEHTTEESCWLIVHGKVYDVTNFLEEHPGGYDIIVTSAGKDATQDFEEIGHSKKAREMLEDYFIGKFEGGIPETPVQTASAAVSSPANKGMGSFARVFLALLPVLLLMLAVGIGVLNKQQ